MGLVTLTFDLLILKLVGESHQRWGTFLPNLGMVGLWVLELFAKYATDGQTDRRMDRQNQRLLSPLLGAGHNKQYNIATLNIITNACDQKQIPRQLSSAP